MTTEELLLIGNLDQSIDVDTNSIEKFVDEIIQKSIVEKDALVALNACRNLIKVFKLSGIALAKFLYLIQENWYVYDTDEEFDTYVYTYVGLHKYTISRYVSAWKLILNLPEKISDELKQKNMREIVPIANAVAQGYEIDDKTWEKLNIAPDLNTVLKIVREEIKELPPRKGSIQLSIDKMGSIWAFANKNKFFVGSLEMDSDEDIVQKSIQRIIKGSGIMER